MSGPPSRIRQCTAVSPLHKLRRLKNINECYQYHFSSLTTHVSTSAIGHFTGFTANGSHPNFVRRTNLLRNTWLHRGLQCFGSSPEKGARTPEWIPASPKYQGNISRNAEKCNPVPRQRMAKWLHNSAALVRT